LIDFVCLFEKFGGLLDVYFRGGVAKMGFEKKYLGCVGRGVLRFWGPRYRQSRSNLGYFWHFVGISEIEGVDII